MESYCEAPTAPSSEAEQLAMTLLPFPLPLPLPAHLQQPPTSSHPELSEASNLPASPKPPNSGRPRRRRRRRRRRKPSSVVPTVEEEKAGTKISVPDDILFEILIRTDVETLSSITRVCKKWRGLFSDPFFISQHHLKTKYFRGVIFVNRPLKFSFLRDPYLPPSCCGPLPSLDFMPAGINFMVEAFTPHGLLLCSHMRKYELYICKPTTREFIQIPIPKDDLFNKMRMVLAVAPTSRLRFRIVRVHENTLRNRYRLSVFDSDSWGEWKKLAVDQDILSGSILNESSNLVNGHFCWWSSRESRIVCLDVWTGKVELIELGEGDSFDLANIENGLGLIRRQEGVTEYWRLRSITTDHTWEKIGSLRLHKCFLCHDLNTIVDGVVFREVSIDSSFYYNPRRYYRW